MYRLRVRRPSPSLVISVVALFVAMGGTGYAAVTHLGKNTVGAAQIKTGAVGSAEVKNKSLKTADLSAAAINSLRGKTGPQGQPGTNGTNGAPGPSDAWSAPLSGGQASFSLPPGSYVLGGGASASNGAGGVLNCFWNTVLPSDDTSPGGLPPGQVDTVTSTGSGSVSPGGAITVTGSSNFTATLACSAPSGATLVGVATATKVGTLH